MQVAQFVFRGRRGRAVAFGRILVGRLQLGQLRAAAARVVLDMPQVQAGFVQLRSRGRPRLLQLRDPPLRHFAIGLVIDLLLDVLGRRFAEGLLPGLPRDDEQQQHQRPHRADEHGEKREQRDTRRRAAHVDGSTGARVSCRPNVPSRGLQPDGRRVAVSLRQPGIEQVDCGGQADHGFFEVFRPGQGREVAVERVLQAH